MPDSSWGGCQPAKVDSGFSVPTKHGITKFPQGIRVEAKELIYRLVRETDMRGYHFGVPGNASYGCWGYYCRKIAGTNQYSYHTTCAVDINAPKNPQGDRLVTDMPGWMPDLWNAYGFRWGGDYKSRPDAMHYEFLGSLADMARMTKVARDNRLGENRAQPPTPVPTPPKRKDESVYALMKGDASSEWWLTDMQTKRHMKSPEEAQAFIYMIVANGGICDRGPNNSPRVWPQAFVDNIARADSSNLVDATMKWYAKAGNSPLHSIVRQVMKDEVQETPDAG